jgi:tetratricopeptide (TPR) repeat protein/phage tail protein X
MTVRAKFAITLAAAAMLLGAGCGGGGEMALPPEIDDPTYRQGKQLQRQGRDSEALAAFLKVIETRGDRAAPESHFEVAELYLQHVKDPIAAIYHFRKYLELQPNSPHAPGVRERIGTAMREFARTLPARPLEDQSVRLEAAVEIDRLRRENEELRAEVATLRGGATPTYRIARPLGAEEPRTRKAAPEPEPAPIIVAPRPAASEAGEVPRRTAPAPVTQPAPAPVTQPPPAEPRFVAPQALPPAAGVRSPVPPTRPGTAIQTGRTHRVAPQESLLAIARRYYGTPTAANVQAIRDANPGVNMDALQPGMIVRIP